MRTGPSRLTSTASSIGESNDTVAAEWMTMSHDAERLAARVVEPEAVGADVTGDDRDPPRHLLVEAARPARAEAVEGVVAEDLPLHPLRGRARRPGADQQDELAVGHRTQEPLDQRGAEEAGRPGDGDAPAGEGLPDHLALSTKW